MNRSRGRGRVGWLVRAQFRFRTVLNNTAVRAVLSLHLQSCLIQEQTLVNSTAQHLPPSSFNSPLRNRATATQSKMAPEQVIHAYRHLYRAALKAVCYSQPASTVARNQLRSAFRAGDATSFNQRAVRRTIWFLNNAAKVTGTEHRVVKNLLMVKYWRDRTARDRQPTWKAISKGAARKKQYVLVILPEDSVPSLR